MENSLTRGGFQYSPQTPGSTCHFLAFLLHFLSGQMGVKYSVLEYMTSSFCLDFWM